MALDDVLFGALRLAHALAAALWVGGLLAFTLAGTREHPAFSAPSWVPVREALRLGIGVFVITGVIIAVERLGGAPLPPTYLAVLGAKVALGLWMFVLARQLGTVVADGGASVSWWRPERKIVALGVVIYVLAMVLRAIYENTIRA